MEILVVIGGLILAMICRLALAARREARKHASGSGSDLQALVREGYGITADLLEAGKEVSGLSGGKYQGTISVRFHSRRGGLSGITVCMYDSGDLREALAEQSTLDPGDRRTLERFVQTYGGCYDKERDALVCQSHRAVRLSPEEKLRAEALLHRRLETHPLAIFEDISLIHTCGLGKF